MVRKILVPLDGSTFAEHALPLAQALARRSGAGIHLVTVSTPLTQAYIEGVYVGSADLEAEVSARYQAYLNAITARLEEHIDVPITSEVIVGEVAPMLCQVAASGRYDLMVMATHGRSPMGRFWLGSVADEMVRHVNLPLLLVRPREEEPRFEEEPDLSRVVVSLDGTDVAEQILEPAVELAKLIPEAEIILLRAVWRAIRDDVAPDLMEVDNKSARITTEMHPMADDVYREAEVYLARIARKLEARGLKVRTHVVAEDDPAEAILHEANGDHVGLIALETHGRSGLARLFFGSIADKVVHGTHVPVLIHRPVQV